MPRRHALAIVADMDVQVLSTTMTTAATMEVMSTAAEVATPMEVPASAEGEANSRAISIVVGIGLVVRIGVVAITPERSLAVPVSAVTPTPPTAAVVYLLDV